MAHEKATAWDDGQLLSMQVVAQVQGVLERFQVAIAQQVQQLGMQQQYHQAMHQQMLQQVLQQQQEQKALLQRSREEGTSQSTTRGHWPQVYMQPPAGQHPALSKQPLLQLPPLLQSIPTAKSERPIRKPRAAKSQAEEKLSERPNRQVSPGSCRDEVQNEEPKLEKDDENVQNVMDMKASEAEAKATEVVEVVEMDVSVAQPMAEGTPEKAQVVQVVQVAERQNAPDTQSSADAEYMSRIERCHEEAMKKVQVATEEAEESKEKDESNVEESEEATSGGALLGSAKSRNEAEHSGRGWSPDQATATPNARAPLRGVRRALAEVEIDLEESDKEEGFSDYYDEDEEEVSDDEGRSNRFGLQFERVVPESAYSVSAEDGLMMDPKQSNKRDYELEEVIADRWWSRLRRRFFRHNYRAYGLVEGQWQRVPDPRGPRYKPRKRHCSRLQKKEEKMKREMQSRSR